jgi:hypothetical protein
VERKAAICFVIAVVGLAAFAPVPALAQGQLPPFEVITIVRSMGMDPLGRPVRRGAAYVLRALDGYGQEVMVAVDARQGRVLSVRPVMPVAAPYGPPGQAYTPPPYSVEPPYVPEAEPYYPAEAEFESDYEPVPPRAPRVIYAPRVSYDVPQPPARAPAAKASASKTKPKATVAAKPAEASATELTTGSAPAGTVPAETSSAPAIPPVQSLE